MQLGLRTSLIHAAAAQSAGWDFIEENALTLLGAHDQPPDRWHGADFASASPLKIAAAHSLVPADHAITGPEADRAKLSRYMAIAFSRAQRVGIKTLSFTPVLDAREEQQKAVAQLAAFLSSITSPAEDHGIIVAVGPCPTHARSAQLLRQMDHPAVRLLLVGDAGALDELRDVAGLVHHVHLPKGGDEPLMRALKAAHYNGRVSLPYPSPGDVPGVEEFR